MASLLVMGGSNFRGNFGMYQLQPRRFVPDPPPAPAAPRDPPPPPAAKGSHLTTVTFPEVRHHGAAVPDMNDDDLGRTGHARLGPSRTAASSLGASFLELRRQREGSLRSDASSFSGVHPTESNQQKAMCLATASSYLRTNSKQQKETHPTNDSMTWSSVILRDVSNQMRNIRKGSVAQTQSYHHSDVIPTNSDSSIFADRCRRVCCHQNIHFHKPCQSDERSRPFLCSCSENDQPVYPYAQPVSYVTNTNFEQELNPSCYKSRTRHVDVYRPTNLHGHRKSAEKATKTSNPNPNPYSKMARTHHHQPVMPTASRKRGDFSVRAAAAHSRRPCPYHSSSSMSRGACGVCSADARRLTDASGLQGGGDLAASMPDLRRETVVLSQHTPAKNIPIIDDDDETNIDDEEDFFPAFMKNRLLGGTAESDRSSSDHEDRRRMRLSDPLGRRSGGLDPRRWGSRISLGNEDRANSLDFDDTDDQDTWSETTEVIYPPSEPESVDTFASTFQVFAADGGRKAAKRTSNIHLDEADSESTDHVSLEDQDEEEGNEEAFPTSSASTPSDPEREFMPRTPDKELFLKENFESVNFTPVAMDKFAQQVATLERAAVGSEVSDVSGSMPFSPRLSLSSKFLSRSQLGAARAGGGLGGGQRPDSWFDPLRKTKSEIARAMDETRERLADMNWHTGGLLQESPEKEDPPSPPTKLDNKEPSFSTPKLPTNTDFGGGKLETDHSPIPPSPTKTMPSSPLRGMMTAKDKPRGGNGLRSGETNGGSSASSAPPPRQVPSYFRTTKSSRLKSSSASSLLKQPEVLQPAIKVPASNLCSSKNEGPAKRRINKNRLSSSRLAMYASTPNLANFHDEDGEEVEKEEVMPQALGGPSSSSNLLSLAELSLSVPGDINGLDDPAASTDSSSSSSGPAGRRRRSRERAESGGQRQAGRSPSRRSLPAGTGNATGSDLRLSLAVNHNRGEGEGLTDIQLMPPPPPAAAGFQPSRGAAQSSLLRRAVQARKRSTSELTLEQAKSILLGNSGILGTQQVSPEEEESPGSRHLPPPGDQHQLMATRSSNSSTSTLNFVSSRNNSTSSRTNSSSSTTNVFDNTDTSGYTSANTLAVAEEIDRTANQLRRERERAAAAALDASRYDPPERDQPSAQKPQQAAQAGVTSSRVTFSDSAMAEREGSVSGDEDSPQKLSVQERIALLNQHTPKQGSPESVRLSVEGRPNRSPSPRLTVVKSGRRSSSPAPPEPPSSAAAVVVVQSHFPSEQRVSPRSQSDTGLGSDTDTDSDARGHTQHTQQAGDVGAARGDRSRLSLYLTESSSSSSSQPAASSSSSSSNEDSLRTCMSVVSDLKLAVERAKDFLSQINSGNNASSANQRQMTSMLSEAFREAHLTLAQLSLQSPVMEGGEGEAPPKPPSCPLVPEGAAGGGWDDDVMDKARDMLQPFMALLSRELSEELVKVIRDRLDGKQPPPAP